jgi:hypothetical protein
VADNEAKIDEVNELLDSGAKRVTLPDGQTTEIDPIALRKRRAELAAADDEQKSKRPRILGMNLRGVT